MDVLHHEKKHTPVPMLRARQQRSIAQWCLIALLIVTCAVTSFYNFPRLLPSALHKCTHTTATNYTQQALDILSSNPLIDGHVDLAIFIRAAYSNQIYGPEFVDKFENGGLAREVDSPRLDAGKYGGAFWSAFYLCPKDIFDFSDENYAPIVRATLEQIDLYHRLGAKYPHYFTRPATAAAGNRAFHSPARTLISPIIIEGLHQIGNSLSTLRLYHALGVRYATLNWNCHNVYSDAALLMYANFTTVKAPAYHGGLSLRGRAAVREMNRMGMIVDLAHTSFDTQRDVLVGQHNYDAPHSHSRADEEAAAAWTGSLAPPIYSHSSAHALCPHPRNVPDDILQLVRRRNSVVMVNFNPDFISCGPLPANSTTGIPPLDQANNTLAHVADHITHIGDLVGYAHVGLGSDFDGIEGTPRGLEDVSKVVALVAELLRRGVGVDEVVGVVGGNVLRVWGEVDRVAAELQGKGVLPVEDEIKKGW